MNNEDEQIFQFLISFVEPLIVKLSGEEDRETAIKWIQKIVASENKSLRLKYLKFLLFMLQMGQLLSPFDTEVDVNSELDDMPEDVTDRDLYNYVTIKVTGKPLQKGRTTLPVMSTVTENEQVFQAVQIIPGVGIRCYFAASMLPIKHWFKSCAFHMPPSTDVRTVDQAVNTFTDFIRVQMKRSLIADGDILSASTTTATTTTAEPIIAEEESATDEPTMPTSPLPRFYDPEEWTPATTGSPIALTPPPTLVVPRKRAPRVTTTGDDEHLLDVDEPEFEVRPVRDYRTGRDLIAVEEEEAPTQAPGIRRIFRELEEIFPCPRTTTTPTDVQPSSTIPPLREIVAEFEGMSDTDIITTRRPATITTTTTTRRPAAQQVQDGGADEDRPISPKRSGRYELPDEEEQREENDDEQMIAEQWPDGEPMQKIIDALLIEPLQIRIKPDFADIYKVCKNLPDEFVITWGVRKDFMQLTRSFLFDVFQASDLPSSSLKGTPGFPVVHDYDNAAYSQNVILRMIVVDNLYSIVSTLSPPQLDFFFDFIQEYPYNRPRHLISSTIGELGSTNNLDRIIPMPDTGGQSLPLPRPRRVEVTTTTASPTTRRPITRRTTTTRPTTSRPVARTARRPVGRAGPVGRGGPVGTRPRPRKSPTRSETTIITGISRTDRNKEQHEFRRSASRNDGKRERRD